MKAKNIEWDVDSGDNANLPTEVDIPEHLTDVDAISDYLSDLTGYCHKGFQIEGRRETMLSTEEIINVLYRDGYHAAAHLLEESEKTINKAAELEYLREFVRGNCFNTDFRRSRLQSLWTAFCLHHDIYADTAEYGETLISLWTDLVDSCPEGCSGIGACKDCSMWESYEEFEGFMRIELTKEQENA